MRANLIIAGATVVAATHPALERLNKRDAEECASVAQDIMTELTDFPTPDSSVLRFLASQTQLITATDSCVFPQITGAGADGYSSYVNELSSWYNDQQEGVSSLLEACKDVPEVSEYIESATMYATCTEVKFAGATGSSNSDDSSDDKDSGSSSSGDSKDDSSDSKDDGNAASSATLKIGIVGAVAAFAGMIML
ncbi:hypothetical protein ACJ41O_014358 [Fusarium nematophilum]